MPMSTSKVMLLFVLIPLMAVFFLLERSNPTITAAPSADEEWIPLFNGETLEGWYTWLPTHGKNSDPDGVFQVHDGMLHILDIPETDEEQEFGYIATENEYGNYHLRFEYKWGEKKFAPRAELKRDSGVLYHMVGADRIWPTSVESQVQEGDTGDYFLLGGTSLTTEMEPGTDIYQAGGERSSTGGRVIKSSTEDSLTEWNVSEVIVRGDSSVHIVNGVVVNRGFDIRHDGQPLTRGRILFQAEGAEIFYRNIEIKPLPEPGQVPYNVLLFSKTAGFRHSSIPDAIAAIQALGEQHDFVADSTEDATTFTDANLARYGAVVFLMTTGDVLDAIQQAAFEQYIRGGGGYVGIHSASDTEYSWPWYGELVGAYFDNHPSIQQASINVEDSSHISTVHLADPWVRNDEWYNFQSNPRGEVNVLAALDESTYTGGTMGDHPIAWYHEYDGGRAWYTGGGHTRESYSEPDFVQHILGGIQYATSATDPPPPPTDTPVPTPTITSTDTPTDTPIAPTATPTATTPPPGPALDRSDWTVSASTSNVGDPPEQAIDGLLSTRWSTGENQSPGQFFQIDLGAQRTFSQVVLQVVEQLEDYPRGYAVYVSNTPDAFGAPIVTGNGDGPVTTIAFATQSARYIRIVQTGSAAAFWWSIYEVRVYAPSGTLTPPPTATPVSSPTPTGGGISTQIYLPLTMDQVP